MEYIFRRLFYMIPMLLGVTLIVFIISQLVPIDPLAAIIPSKALSDPEIRQAAIEKWGLDKPPAEQYLNYVWRLLHGDLGTSFVTRQPVTEDLLQFLPATFELTLAALLFAVLVGLPLGVFAALRSGGWVDHVARSISLLGVSAPPFWLGLMALFVFYATLSILPGPGRIDPRILLPEHVTGLLIVDSIIAKDSAALVSCLRHLILPSVILGWFPLAVTARVTRASMLEVLRSDYIRTAHAKGLHPWKVTVVHALRNALIPTVTVLGLSAASLLTGAVTVETVFAWPGIGNYMVNASTCMDYPAVMGATLVIGVLFMISSLAVDLLYGVLNPQMREE